MCRFLAYKGSPILLDDLLYQPEHSLIKQSYDAKEMEEPLNGDGFGIGWYDTRLDDEPGIFNSIQPAWNNKNLRSLARKIHSGCLFSHVRAASVGDVTQQNCHPFRYQKYMMMHNGGIKDFDKIRRPITEKLSDERYRWIDGQTDSQHIFALILDYLIESGPEPVAQDYLDAFCKAFEDLEDIKAGYGLNQPSFLNLMITDGNLVVGCRYSTDSDKEPRSLYHSEGGRYECNDGKCLMNKDCPDHDKAVLIVSERLNANENEWFKVPTNHMLVVNNDLDINFKPI